MKDVQTPQNPYFNAEISANIGLGKPGTQATARHSQAIHKTPSLDQIRSFVLDLPFPDLARLGPGARCRQARYRHFLASDGLQALLAIEESAAEPGPASSCT